MRQAAAAKITKQPLLPAEIKALRDVETLRLWLAYNRETQSAITPGEHRAIQRMIQEARVVVDTAMQDIENAHKAAIARTPLKLTTPFS